MCMYLIIGVILSSSSLVRSVFYSRYCELLSILVVVLTDPGFVQVFIVPISSVYADHLTAV
jgi:hypothetical protein